MPKIKKLPENVIAQIAAGQVVERPSSVVKELIENSLDADSKNIKIKISNIGLDKIVVSDDGDGMEKEDLLNCFKRHTSSKINTTEDLNSISTLGFRGEALYSISSSAEVIIKTRQKGNNEGNLIHVKNGKIIRKESVGIPTGTTVEVSDLFENLPARKKFLKSKRTEYGHILNIVTSFALAFPEVGFNFFNNEKEVFSYPSNQSLQDRMHLVYENGGDKFFEVSFQKDYIDLKGFLFKPQHSIYSRSGQYLFINKRPVFNSNFSNWVKSAYGNLVSSNQHPKFILFLKIPSNLIDVNVHPRKEKISFFNEDEIKEIIKSELKDSLNQKDLTFKTPFKYSFKGGNYGFLADKLKDSVTPWNLKEDAENNEILQVGKLYLITQDKEGLLLIDQHAAHEKILYDQFIESFKKGVKETVELSPPLVVDLSVKNSEILKNNLDFFYNLGFEIEEFGGTSFKISSAPAFYQKDFIKDIILETLADLEKEEVKELNKSVKEIISYLACRTAIKANEYLTKKERERLVEKVLDSKPNTYTCPHGRPVMVRVGLEELERMFYRR